VRHRRWRELAKSIRLFQPRSSNRTDVRPPMSPVRSNRRVSPLRRNHAADRPKETVMEPPSSNPTASRRPRRRLLVKTLLAACVFAATITGSAQPAHAATTVLGCFLMEDGNLSPYPVTV